MNILIIITCITWLLYIIHKVLRHLALNYNPRGFTMSVIMAIVRLFYYNVVIADILDDLHDDFGCKLVKSCCGIFMTRSIRVMVIQSGYELSYCTLYDQVKYYKLLIDKYLIDPTIAESYNDVELEVVKNYIHL